MNFSSSLLENAVNEFAKLPGIGKKTALRLALYLLKKDTAEVDAFAEAIKKMKHEVSLCPRCGNLSDNELCTICKDPARKKRVICVVENIRDVIAIESTHQFSGLYHVLGGIISPLDGVGPDQLNIDSLIARVNEEEIEELIFALSPNIQGDTTIYYISKKLADSPVKITTIARGIAFGGELEYADELTLARSIANRLPIDSYVSGM
ncbi:MAG: recombination protein RecR [Chitinophagaceae bacterium]|nr:recombination protein RecR [Chitinophagaceae bacterium]